MTAQIIFASRKDIVRLVQGKVMAINRLVVSPSNMSEAVYRVTYLKLYSFI